MLKDNKITNIIFYINRCLDRKQTIGEIAKTIQNWEEDEEVEAAAMNYLNKLSKIQLIEANF